MLPKANAGARPVILSGDAQNTTSGTTVRPWRSRKASLRRSGKRSAGGKTERMMKRYAAVTDETLRVAAEAVAGSEVWEFARRSTVAR